MKYRRKNINTNRKRWFGRTERSIINIIDFFMLLFSVSTAFLSNQNEQKLRCSLFIISVSCAALAVILKTYIFIRQIADKKEYEAALLAEKMSDVTLKHFKEANSNKRRCILQSTYGRVPKWHPIDYTQNVLVYDVHEQIRLILSGMQKLIIETSDGLTEDQVTVDLVYCYPQKNNNDNSAQTPSQHRQKDNGWRIITSGNHSLGGSIHSYLKNKASFYHYVDDCGYCFCNDKMECIENGHYLISDKDKEQTSKGSIVGVKMELRNDEPEAVFVQAILTITTYGKKLYEKGPVQQSVYEEKFKENVINSYRSLLLSELSQMYIRHAILEGDMCPKTGQLISETKEENDQSKKDDLHKCQSTGKECRFCDTSQCSCKKCRRSQ